MFSKRFLKQSLVLSTILFISIWSLFYIQKSDYLSNTTSQIDYNLEKLVYTNKNIIDEIHAMTTYSIYNNDHINAHIKTQSNQVQQLKNNDFFTSNNYPLTRKNLLEFDTYQKEFLEDIEQFSRLNAKIKNSYTYVISLIGKLNFSNKEEKKLVAKTLSTLIRIKNSMDANSLSALNINLDFLQRSPHVQKNLFKVHIDLLKNNLPQYIELVNRLLENKKSKELLHNIEDSIHTENAIIIDNHIKEFYAIIFFTFVLLLLVSYYINTIEKDKENIIKLQKAYTQSLITDELTGLKNRSSYMKEISKLDNVTLLQFNIIDFTSVNTLHGQKTGDFVLKEISNILQQIEASNENIKAFRYGSDKFLLSIMNSDKNTAYQLCENVIQTIESSQFTNEAIHIDVIAGISCKKPYILTSDYALKSIKYSFDKKIGLFNESMIDNQEIQNNKKTLSQLKNAINTNHLLPVFQPIIDLKTGETIKYESLIRMQVDDKLISPFFFLELSKQAKLYAEITKTVLIKSIQAVKEKNIPVSINLSIEDILHQETNTLIKELLNKNKKIAHLITFELLESEEITNFIKLQEFIKQIKSYGCQIAIDDFGSGFSNYAYLVELHVDIIKIDGSLIKNIHQNNNNRLIVKSIVEFAQSIGIKVVAEFVSSKEIETVVKELQIDFAQGFYFSEPKTLEELNIPKKI